jgi:hypothetical protein
MSSAEMELANLTTAVAFKPSWNRSELTEE